ncbi:lipopolysaccharide biosynthesis protein [Microlunatus flavus]|uniref:Polysaccharide transporter, PST family n=1 Tax=Microlunatus flavus TaxID=1036181 RepID=A0A1H9KMF2_9ACTN|nr:lipopolysaccharide biosynthesis protein [Microlunatus flavus]SER00087.1 polysaccharide transporter, PST family [Microlunatus flavus]
MSLAGTAARGAATTMGGQWLRFVLQIGTLAVLARLLDPNDYGLVAMVLAIAGVATVLGDFGLSFASVQAAQLDHVQRSTLFWLNLAIGLVLAGALEVLAPLLAGFYERPEVVDITRVVAVVFVLNAAAAQFKAEMSRGLRFRWLAGADVLAQLLGSGAAVVVALLGGAYWALVTQQVVVAATTLVVVVLASGWWPGLPRRRAGIGPLVRFGGDTLGVQLATYVTSNIDSVLIGRFWGPLALGAYDRAYQIFRLPMHQIAAPVTRVALPVLSRVQASPEFSRYVQRTQLAMTYGMGGASFLVAALAGPGVALVLGPGWESTSTLLRVLALGGPFQALGFVYYWVFLARGLTRVQLHCTLATRGVMVVLMVVGVLHSAVGVAVGATVGLVLNWVVLCVVAAPRAGIDVGALVRQALRPLAVGAGLLAVTWPLTPVVDGLGSVAQLAVLLGVCAAYLALVGTVVRPVRRDLAALRSMSTRLRRTPAPAVVPSS